LQLDSSRPAIAASATRLLESDPWTAGVLAGGLSVASGVLVERNGPGGLRLIAEQGLNVPNRLRFQQDVSTDAADFGRNMIDDHNPASMPNRMGDLAGLVFSRTSLDGALHDFLPL
jgi:hypothetical protein